MTGVEKLESEDWSCHFRKVQGGVGPVKVMGVNEDVRRVEPVPVQVIVL